MLFDTLYLVMLRVFCYSLEKQPYRLEWVSTQISTDRKITVTIAFESEQDPTAQDMSNYEQ